MKKSEPPTIIEETFNASIEKVWNSITQVDQMHKWYFENIPEFKPEVGFETQFIVKSETREFTHQWKVLEVVPQRLIKYNWKYAEFPGDSNISFELIEYENTTKLKLTHEVLEDFPSDIPEFERESCIGGWQYFINQMLKDYLEKN